MAVIRPCLRQLLALICVLLLAPVAASAHEGHAAVHEGPEAAAQAERARVGANAVPDLVSPCPGGQGDCCCDPRPASSGSPHIEVAAAGPVWLAFFATRSTARARGRDATAPAAKSCLISCRPRAPPAP